jgi:hypothetical protein
MSSSRENPSPNPEMIDQAAVIQILLASLRHQFVESNALKEEVVKNYELIQKEMIDREHEISLYHNQVLAFPFATKQQYTLRDAMRRFGLAKATIQAALLKTAAATAKMISVAETGRNSLIVLSRSGSSREELQAKLAKFNQEMVAAIFVARSMYLELTKVSVEVDGDVKKSGDVLLEAWKIAQLVAQEVQLLVAAQTAQQIQWLAAAQNTHLQSGASFHLAGQPGQSLQPGGMPFAWQAASALAAHAQPQAASSIFWRSASQSQSNTLPLKQGLTIPTPLEVPGVPSVKRLKAAAPPPPSRAHKTSSVKPNKRSKKAKDSASHAAASAAPSTNPASLVGLSIFIPPPSSSSQVVETPSTSSARFNKEPTTAPLADLAIFIPPTPLSEVSPRTAAAQCLVSFRG